MSHEDRLVEPEVVESADHVGGVRFEAVAGLRLVRVAPAGRSTPMSPRYCPR